MVAKELGLRGAVGVGHSLGGHAMALAAAMEPAAFSSLLLVDPVIQMPDRYDGHAKGRRLYRAAAGALEIGG